MNWTGLSSRVLKTNFNMSTTTDNGVINASKTRSFTDLAFMPGHLALAIIFSE